MCAKTLLFETALPEPFDARNKETAPSFMERVIGTHSVTKAKKEMAGTVAESASYVTEYNLQPPLTSACKQLSETRSKVEPVLINFGVVTRTDVKVIVKSS